MNAPQQQDTGKALPRDLDVTQDQRLAPQQQEAVAPDAVAVPGELSAIDRSAMQRVAAGRLRDTEQARVQLGLNAVEPSLAKEKQPLAGGDELGQPVPRDGIRDARATAPVGSDTSGAGNRLESDEIFTATQPEVKRVVPPEIEQYYLRVGDRFYHPKNTDLIAFEDKGNRLETRSDSEAIAESMVRIAQARGWDEIKVSGSEAFRKEVWLEAAARGMHIKGYTPSDKDLAALARRGTSIDGHNGTPAGRPVPSRDNTSSGQVDSSVGLPPAQAGKPVSNAVGVLVAHGAAKYLHDARNTDSYYVTTRDDQGVARTVWGVDLQRAMDGAGAQPGDRIVLASEGRQRVTVSVPLRDDNGAVIGVQEKETLRKAWRVDMASTFARESPSEAVRKYPELAGAAAAIAVMDRQSEADGLTPAQRTIVATRVRQNVVNSIARGHLPQVAIKENIDVQRAMSNDLDHTR